MAQAYLAKLDEYLYQPSCLSPYFEKFEAKTKCKRTYLALGFIVFVLLYIVFGYGGSLICNMVGFLYPAYMSIKAIESVRKDDDTQWLTYWVVYGAFSVAEFFTDLILSWFPFYFIAKLAFLGWCMAPYEWNGANFIYNKFLYPFFKKHESKIDNYVQQGTEFAKNAQQQGMAEASRMAGDIAAEQISQSFKDEEEKKDE